ncbi:endonuclease domain-containing protein [Brevundimonas sp. Leaf363]|uniref:endonuclease domain-containing protein n=1 Tax=Brevundimonas sp. Leaf363 TaxID=1736353 RepID=UPI0009E68325|nr:DUF559 domain-containing protein [Brevundimonas sp. Leaf363]
MRGSIVTHKRARALRRKMTLPEVLLWQRLKGRGFRKQHPLEPYILDFFHEATSQCFEVDGQDHDEAHDVRREAFVASQGIKTVRIPAKEILKDPDEVAEYVLTLIRSSTVKRSETGEGDRAKRGGGGGSRAPSHAAEGADALAPPPLRGPPPPPKSGGGSCVTAPAGRRRSRTVPGGGGSRRRRCRSGR